jgi:mRNA-degrading endonuclease RelE of RelBE toxin-antitoxin system
MVVILDPLFEQKLAKIKNFALKRNIWKRLQKIIGQPDIGKPMRSGRKGTREVYVGPLRLSYIYETEKDIMLFLDLYHKDEQ